VYLDAARVIWKIEKNIETKIVMEPRDRLSGKTSWNEDYV
jgi:hypothetical protein